MTRLRLPSGTGIDPNAATVGDGGIYGLSFSEDDANVVLVPVGWDATTSYRAGAALGPAAILAASRQVDLLDIDLGSVDMARPWRWGIHMAAPNPRIAELNEAARPRAVRIIARGGEVAGDDALAKDLDAVNAASAELNEIVYRETKRLLDAGKVVGLVGGEHSVSFGAIRAHAERYPEVGVLHLDAHADLRRAYEGFDHSHASILWNVLEHIEGIAAVTQVGVRDLCDEEFDRIQSDERVTTFFDSDLRARAFGGSVGGGWAAACDDIVETLPELVYATFDIDGLDPKLCPSTGTPVPGGLDLLEASYLLKAVHRSGRRLVGFDLTEVAPRMRGPLPDGDEWDGNVGARLLYKLVAVALLGHGADEDQLHAPSR